METVTEDDIGILKIYLISSFFFFLQKILSIVNYFETQHQ